MTRLVTGLAPTLARRLRGALWMALLAVAGVAAWASPGAHGPNGEHLDAPAPGAKVGSRGAPRLEASSEAFELVAVLRADELSMFVNRFETGEPVLDARVEVESGNLKAVARFHADLGDYAVDDAAFVGALQAPGEHAVVVTILAGKETDLLDGTLRTSGNAEDHPGRGAPEADPRHGIPRAAWIAGSVLTVLGLVVWLRRGRSPRPSTGAAR